MAGFRNRFIKIFSKLGNVVPSRLLLNITNQKLIFPYYHCISNESVPHIRHLYPLKNEKSFEQDLDFLLSMYEPIDLIRLQQLNRENKRPSKPSFLLSFDDGLKEFHDVIAPVLLKKGIPATVFLNSAFIDNKDIFYRYKASLLIEYLNNNPAMNQNKNVNEWLSQHSIGSKDLSKFLLTISYLNRNYLDELASLVQYSFMDYLSVQQPYLTSNQIDALKNKGFHFGAHSIDHPEYRFINFEEQIRQTKESVEDVFSRFSLNYKAFSFPFTDYKVKAKFFEKVYHDQIADITFGCAGMKKEVFLNHFQRISFEMDDLSAKEIYNAELLYFMMKALFGKNTIKRL